MPVEERTMLAIQKKKSPVLYARLWPPLGAPLMTQTVIELSVWVDPFHLLKQWSPQLQKARGQRAVEARLPRVRYPVGVGGATTAIQRFSLSLSWLLPHSLQTCLFIRLLNLRARSRSGRFITRSLLHQQAYILDQTHTRNWCDVPSSKKKRSGVLDPS